MPWCRELKPLVQPGRQRYSILDGRDARRQKESELTSGELGRATSAQAVSVPKPGSEMKLDLEVDKEAPCQIRTAAT